MKRETIALRWTSLIAVAGLAALAPTWPARAQESPPAAEEAKAADAEKPDEAFGEEITVTAQKREEVLEEIPMAITAVPGETLERMRVESFEDLTSVVPGFSITSVAPGVTRITLRGINTGGVASTVGVYVDDVPFGSSSGLANAAILSGDFDSFDLSRVEVLRGPQGTLYGASSLSGVLRYIPNRASTDGFETKLQGSLEAIEGGDLGYSLTGAVNVPVSDRFAFRASGFYRSDDGFIDSVGDNPVPSLTDPAHNIYDGTRVEDGINGLDRYGFRLSALFEPSDNFSIYLTGQVQEIQADAPSIVDADPLTAEPIQDRVQSKYLSQAIDTKYEIYSATLDWGFGGASLQSITSWSQLNQDNSQDLTFGTPLTGGIPLSSFITFLFGDPATRPLSVAFPEAIETEKVTQELRLVSAPSESFEWLIGAFYTDEDSRLGQQLLAVEAQSEAVANGIPPLAVVSLDSSYEEIALFANATWHLTSRFELGFGGRWSDNDQVASQISDGALVGGLTQFDEVESSESPFTWSVSPRFELDDRSSIYVRLATGFRPGGPNVLPPGAPADTPSTYDSDSLTSYEAGWKSTSSDGRLSLDLALFYLDWDDIQLNAVVNNFGINANGGTAVSKGAEVSVGLTPANGLTLNFNAAYTDAYLTQDTDPIVGGQDGDPLSWVPEWMFGVYGDYAWPVFGDALAHVGGNISYTGDRPADFGTRTAGGSIREFGAYTTVGLSGGIDFGAWSIELYGKNLTDEDAVTSVDTGGFLPNGAVGLAQIQPRTIGIALGTKF